MLRSFGGSTGSLWNLFRSDHPPFLTLARWKARGTRYTTRMTARHSGCPAISRPGRPNVQTTASPLSWKAAPKANAIYFQYTGSTLENNGVLPYLHAILPPGYGGPPAYTSPSQITPIFPFRLIRNGVQGENIRCDRCAVRRQWQLSAPADERALPSWLQRQHRRHGRIVILPNPCQRLAPASAMRSCCSTTSGRCFRDPNDRVPPK